MDMETAIATADQALFYHMGRHLSDVETAILKGAWEGWTYDKIAKGSGYSDSYLRRDVGAKFWRVLSEALGETVSKTSFREALLRHESIAPEPGAIAAQTVPWAGPLPASSANDTIYIKRLPQETICYDTLQQPGALIRVKSPSLMGKTLMMDQVLAKLTEQQLRTVRLSMVLADRKAHFSDLNRFLRWLCINISRSLGVPHQIDDYWDKAGMGSKVSCSTYLEDYLLSISQAPLVLCLDNVDLLFGYPDIYEDFFALLRSWYELARTRTRPIWKQLRLCIVHATDAYIPLNIHQSPFNVGVPIELPEFTPEQAQTFANQHQLSHLDLAQLMDMIGGHPYLMQQTFEYLKGHPEQSLTELLANAPTESGIYANHLRDCWLTLRDQPQLKDSLLTVMTAQQPVALDTILAHQLHSMGIINLQGNLAAPRCRLYRDYFQACLDAT
ncbi:AAA-like domain-containing protein [Leptothoe spongobia]|uniref:AAA-like domain-containing protein n=1 Tax=Leptothoe spongobia TAU-MAC 1115 TaxID=1967444 RepID=A0A947DER5_9CYAN|nr:AAA-like domain-containing protein [Leptothoe spongobia]MBT9315772.1 AAA-like domain-containing protein [Leptothoe spongobia TAU-MAC 1115]